MPAVREVAQKLIDRLDEVREVVQGKRRSVQGQFPQWDKFGKRAGDHFLERDVRVEVFQAIDLNLQSAQLGYVFLRDQLGTKDWWSRNAKNITTGTVEQTIKEWRIHVRAALLYHTVMVIEETIRAIVRAEPQMFNQKPEGNIGPLTGELLSRCGVDTRYGALFELVVT